MSEQRYWFFSGWRSSGNPHEPGLAHCAAVTDHHPFTTVDEVNRGQGGGIVTISSFQEITKEEYALFKEQNKGRDNLWAPVAR